MKRSQGLQALSREHHAALSLARRILKPESDLLALAAQAKESTGALLAHFQEEEEKFLSDLPEALPDMWQRLVNEHLYLRACLQDIEDGKPECLNEFANALIAHVRFEERELFPAFEGLFAS